MHPVDAAAQGGAVEQEGVFGRECEGNAIGLLQEFDPQRMVEVTVGIDRQHGLEAVAFDELLQGGVLARGAVAGIYDDALQRVVPDDVGVLLNRIESKRCDLEHGVRVIRELVQI